MQVETRRFRLPFPVRKGEFIEAYGYLEACSTYGAFVFLHLEKDRLLSTYDDIGEEGSWSKYVDRLQGEVVPQDELWEKILHLNPQARRKGTILGVTDAAALTSEGRVYLNDWSRKGFTHHWLLEEKDNHDFVDLFEWKSVPELEVDSSPSGFTFGVKKGGMPVLVEYRSDEAPEDVGNADIADAILSLDRIEKVEEEEAHLFILHTNGRVSAFCFSHEMLGELVKWRGIVDIRILTGCVAGLTEDGRTLIAPKRLAEEYYDGYRKLKEVPFKDLRKLDSPFYGPLPDDIDLRTAVQLDFCTSDNSYRALLEDGSILIAEIIPGCVFRLPPPFPVDRLICYEEEEFIVLSKDLRAAVVTWAYDNKTNRRYPHLVEFPGDDPLKKVVISSFWHYTTYAYFLTQGGKLLRWEIHGGRFKRVRDGVRDCGSNGIKDAPYFAILTDQGRLQLDTTHRTLYAPCKMNGVKEAVFAEHHIVYLKDNGTVGFMGKAKNCCKGLERYRDVIAIEGTDSTTTLHFADGSSVQISSRKTVRTPPPADD